MERVGGHNHQVAHEGGKVLGPKTTKPSTAAQFQVHHVKQMWRAIGGSGGMGWMKWWWWGYPFANAKQREGQGPTTTKPSAMAQFWVMGRGSGVVWIRWWWWGHVFTNAR